MKMSFISDASRSYLRVAHTSRFDDNKPELRCEFMRAIVNAKALCVDMHEVDIECIADSFKAN